MGTLGPILSLLFLLFWSSFPGPSHQFPEPTPALPEILVSFSQLEFRVLACENPGSTNPSAQPHRPEAHCCPLLGGRLASVNG